MFHNDWITYDYKNLVINEYPNKYFTPSTFQDALIRQAKVIYKDVKPTVFLSGGIDLKQSLLDLSVANLDVEYVYIRPVIMVIIINLIIYLSHSFVVNTTSI